MPPGVAVRGGRRRRRAGRNERRGGPSARYVGSFGRELEARPARTRRVACPAVPGEFEIREVGPEDMGAWVAVYNRAAPCRPVTAEGVAHHRSMEPELLALLALRDGEPVGIAQVWPERHWQPASTKAEFQVMVDRPHRRGGVGTVLAGEVSRWAAGHGCDGLDVHVYENDPDGLRHWLARGFREVSRERHARIELREVAIPPPGPPDGVLLATLAERMDLLESVYGVALEALPDMPAPEPVVPPSFEEWRHAEIGFQELMPEASVLAVAGDEVVGYALLRRFAARPDVGHNMITGVRRSWRGRGVAGAMKRLQAALALRGGLAAIETENDDENAPMRAINLRLGYRPIPDSLWLRGPLQPPP